MGIYRKLFFASEIAPLGRVDKILDYTKRRRG